MESNETIELKIKALEDKLDRHIEQYTDSTDNNRRTHSDLYEKFNALSEITAVSRGITDTKLDNITNLQLEMKKQLEDLLAKPTRKWDAVVSSGIAGIVGAILGLLFGGKIP